ncbi:glutaredoxin family protein [Fusibacter bizertensis]
MKKVIAYTTQTCPHCLKAKQYFRDKGIPFEERDVNSNPSALKEFQMLKLTGVPAFLIGEDLVVGFDQNRIEGLLDFTVEKCPNCAKKMMIPKGKGKLKITCKSCHHQFEHMS